MAELEIWCPAMSWLAAACTDTVAVGRGEGQGPHRRGGPAGRASGLSSPWPWRRRRLQGEWEWWAGVEWDGDVMQCSGVAAGVGWGRARSAGVVWGGGVSGGGGHHDAGCLGGGRHHDAGARQQSRDSSSWWGWRSTTYYGCSTSSIEGGIMLGRRRASGLLESRREEGGHTRWIDRGLVSRGEDVEVAVTAGEAIGGIARLGARCGRDFRGGKATGLARPYGRGRGEGPYRVVEISWIVIQN
jgi:hypothetical protein